MVKLNQLMMHLQSRKQMQVQIHLMHPQTPQTLLQTPQTVFLKKQLPQIIQMHPQIMQTLPQMQQLKHLRIKSRV